MGSASECKCTGLESISPELASLQQMEVVREVNLGSKFISFGFGAWANLDSDLGRFGCALKVRKCGIKEHPDPPYLPVQQEKDKKNKHDNNCTDMG